MTDLKQIKSRLFLTIICPDPYFDYCRVAEAGIEPAVNDRGVKAPLVKL